jgi:predicted ATPase/DNA-binding CsgD family transcriptional regulator
VPGELTGGDAIQATLPYELSSFVGREDELGELHRLVQGTRVLTLCGPGGIGKTRLALRILAAVANEFPDGVWFVELADLRQPDLVVSRIASTVGVTEEPGRALLDTLADALRLRRLLLALDNCEHLIEICARTCQRLLAHAPDLHMLTTSREPLHMAAETVWQVPPLSLAPSTELAAELNTSSEAVRLFADRAASSVPGFSVGPANAPAVADVCRALDGMPLAIELAAARVRALSVEEIRSRLTDRFGLLTTGDRTAPERQRTLRAAIEWSHELLTAGEQVLLRRLSVFAGWSLEMAEQVCSDDEVPAVDVLDHMAALVDKSLVVREPEVLGQARYRMLDTIREYAAARLAAAGEPALFRHRLRDYTLLVAERNLAVGMAQIPAPWSARVDVFRRYDVDADNVAQVLNQCLADEDAQTGLRLCTAVRPCWLVRGSFAEGISWLDSFLGLDAPGVPALVRGAALVGRAQLTLSSDPAAAESDAVEGLRLCRIAGDAFWVSAALNLLSEIALHTGRIGDAAGRAAQAQTLAAAAGDGWNEGYALGTLAAAAGLRGNLREARQLANDSIEVMRAIDQQWGIARTLLGLGDLARLRGDPDEASRNYLQALPVLREIDSRPETARCLAGLGQVAINLGSFGLAREHLSESLRLSRDTGARIGMARGIAAFASLALAEGEPEQAARLIAAASALREAAGLPALPGARTERYLAAVRHLGESAVSRLWQEGLALDAERAVALALAGAPGDDATAQVSQTVRAEGTVRGGGPQSRGGLTAREREIVALIASGHSNKAIAAELVISPATAARHVANILTKLGFTSRAQVAAWATANQLDVIQPPVSRE